jgi:hypothetical protein
MASCAPLLPVIAPRQRQGPRYLQYSPQLQNRAGWRLGMAITQTPFLLFEYLQRSNDLAPKRMVESVSGAVFRLRASNKTSFAR